MNAVREPTAYLLTRLACVAVCGAAALQGCTEAAPQRAASVPPGQRTVVSLVPSVTEIIFALGAGDRQLGRSRYCDWPPEAKKLPVLGDAVGLNFEGLLAVGPDIVVLNTSDASSYSRLRKAGIRCLAPRMETVEEVYQVIDLLGRELGVEAAAGRLTAEIKGELDAVRRAAAGAEPVPTLVTFPMTLGSANDVLAVGRETFVAELLRMAGGRNVVPLSGYPRVSIESVLKWSPQLIIISATGDVAPGLTDAEYIAPWSRWTTLPAVRDGRVRVLHEPYLTLPGPRMGRAARLLLSVLHPDRAAALGRSEAAGAKADGK